MPQRVLAIYENVTRAAQVVRRLRALGVPKQRISVLTSDSALGQQFVAKLSLGLRSERGNGPVIGTTCLASPRGTLGTRLLYVGPIGLAIEDVEADGLDASLRRLRMPEGVRAGIEHTLAHGGVLVAIVTPSIALHGRVLALLRDIGCSQLLTS